MAVNVKIKEYLKEHGITQSWLSDKTGISYKHLNDVLNNRIKISAENLGKIATALNVSADIFLD